MTTTIKKVSRIRYKSKQDTNSKFANILVEFKNSADPADMLIRAKYLKTAKGYESINPDLTAAELKIAYALRKERKEKRELEIKRTTAAKQDKLIA